MIAKSARVVVDTNVLVSACLGSKNARDIVSGIRHRAFRLVTSKSLLEELRTVLARPRFPQGEHFKQAVIEVLDVVVSQSHIVAPKEAIEACRDVKDNQVLETAVAGRAAFIVSGDDDLHALNPFRGIEILAPVDFVARLQHEP